MSESRQLAAIVFSDISGFTSTMEHDETRAKSQIAKHREIITNVITYFNGKLLKEMGDGILLKFTSAIEAVRCATQIQSKAEAEEFNLKIGIHYFFVQILVFRFKSSINARTSLRSL